MKSNPRKLGRQAIAVAMFLLCVFHAYGAVIPVVGGTAFDVGAFESAVSGPRLRLANGVMPVARVELFYEEAMLDKQYFSISVQNGITKVLTKANGDFVVPRLPASKACLLAQFVESDEEIAFTLLDKLPIEMRKSHSPLYSDNRSYLANSLDTYGPLLLELDLVDRGTSFTKFSQLSSSEFGWLHSSEYLRKVSASLPWHNEEFADQIKELHEEYKAIEALASENTENPDAFIMPRLMALEAIKMTLADSYTNTDSGITYQAHLENGRVEFARLPYRLYWKNGEKLAPPTPLGILEFPFYPEIENKDRKKDFEKYVDFFHHVALIRTANNVPEFVRDYCR